LSGLRAAAGYRLGEQRAYIGWPSENQPARRSRRLFDTTNSEDNVLAAPAINGLRRPAAANGNAAML
jgi:hypothetical protein